MVRNTENEKCKSNFDDFLFCTFALKINEEIFTAPAFSFSWSCLFFRRSFLPSLPSGRLCLGIITLRLYLNTVDKTLVTREAAISRFRRPSRTARTLALAYSVMHRLFGLKLSELFLFQLFSQVICYPGRVTYGRIPEDWFFVDIYMNFRTWRL